MSAHQVLLSLGIAISLTFKAFAVPASPETVETLQPDGSKISLRLKGDEWFHWHQTVDGYPAALRSDGYWVYAKPSRDRLGFEAEPEAIVGQTDPSAFGILSIDQLDKNELRHRIATARSGNKTEAPSIFVRSTTSSPTAFSTFESSRRFDLNKYRCVVILAAFSDDWSGSSVSSASGRPRAEYEKLFNEIGHKSSGSYGSVRDYFLENSYGKVDIEFVLSDWVKLPHDEAWYGDNENESTGENRVQILAKDAVKAAEAAGFDFSQGDSNGDHWIDLLFVVHSGYSESEYGNPSDTIWPRQWSLPEELSYDGVSLLSFATSSALRGRSNSASATISGIGTIAHETCHLFGLPDLYDLSDETEGIGTWGLMGYGSWGASSQSSDTTRPVHLSAYSKHSLGWVDTQIVGSFDNLELPPVETHPVVHMINHGLESTNEYFLLEYRKRIGFDGKLPGDGILIWHIDDSQAENNSSSNGHPIVRLEEANGNDLLAGDRFAREGQMWKRRPNQRALYDSSGSATTNSCRYQDDSYYLRENLPSLYTDIEISGFSDPDAFVSSKYETGVMTYDLRTERPGFEKTTDGAGNFDLQWFARDDAENFQIQVAPIEVVTSLDDDAEDSIRAHELWSFSGAARRSNGGAASGDYSYMLSAIDETDNLYLSEIQSMTLRHPFRMKGNTRISFDAISHISTGKGILALLLSNDDGQTWHLAKGVSGLVDPFQTITCSPSDWQAAGISPGEEVRLRFQIDIKNIWGWGEYPNFGFAIDSINIEGAEFSLPVNWTLAAQNFESDHHDFFTREQGEFAYRIRAYSNGAWLPYSSPMIHHASEAGIPAFENWIKGFDLAEDAQAPDLDPDKDGLTNFLEFALSEDPSQKAGPPFPLSYQILPDGTIEITMERGRPDVGYLLEVSSDMKVWQEVEEVNEPLSPNAIFRVADSTTRFARVKTFFRY